MPDFTTPDPPEPRTAPVGALTLRPTLAAFWGGLLSAAGVLVPGFAVGYWISGPSGRWGSLLAGQLVLLAIIACAAYRYWRISVRLREDALVETSLTHTRRCVRFSEVDHCVLVDMRRTLSRGPTRQLFVLGAGGNVLCRLRGEYWRAEDMDTIARAIGAPVVRVRRTVTLDELQRNHPEMLYWFERSPNRLD